MVGGAGITSKTDELSSDSLTCETSKKLNVFHCMEVSGVQGSLFKSAAHRSQGHCPAQTP